MSWKADSKKWARSCPQVGYEIQLSVKCLIDECSPTPRTLTGDELFELLSIVAVENEVGDEFSGSSTEIARNY